MAPYSIQKRDKADGTSKYRCLIRVKKKGSIVYSDHRTFSKLVPAESWAKHEVGKLESEGIPNPSSGEMPLREVIVEYIDDPHVH